MHIFSEHRLCHLLFPDINGATNQRAANQVGTAQDAVKIPPPIQNFTPATGTGSVGQTPNDLAGAGIISGSQAQSQNQNNATTTANPQQSQQGQDLFSKAYGNPLHQGLDSASSSSEATLKSLQNAQTTASPELQSLLDQGMADPNSLLGQLKSDAQGNYVIINGQQVRLPQDILDQMTNYFNAETTRQKQVAALQTVVGQQQINNGQYGNPQAPQAAPIQGTAGAAAPQGTPPAPQLLSITAANFPGTTEQQRVSMRIQARQQGHPGKAMGTSPQAVATPAGIQPLGGAAPTGTPPTTSPSGQPSTGVPGQNGQPQSGQGSPPQGSTPVAAPPPADSSLTGMQAALNDLPPEMQALKPFLSNLLATVQQGQASSDQIASAELNGGTVDVNGQKITIPSINSVYDKVDTQLKEFETGYKKMQDGMQEIIQKTKDQQDQSISEQEQAAQQKAQWTTQQQIRQVEVDKRNAVESAIARAAMTGGWGSSGSAQEISMAGAQYDQKVYELQQSLGVQQTDIGAQFSAQHVTATQSYTKDMVQLLKDSQSEAEKLNGQSFANAEARTKAEQTIIENFQKEHTQNAKDLATSYLGIVKDMQTAILQNKNFERLTGQQSTTTFDTQLKLFGHNMPQNLIDAYAKEMNIDPVALTAQIRSDPLVSEYTTKGLLKTGGGTGGTSTTSSPSFGFPVTQLQGDGNPVGYDDFVKQKKAEIMANTNLSANDLKAALNPATLKAEYNARSANHSSLDLTQINNQFESGISKLAGPEQKNARATFAKYVKNASADGGAGAAQYADSFMKDMNLKQHATYDQTIKILPLLSQADAAYRTLASEGKTGPFAGKAYTSLPSWDAAQTTLKNVNQQINTLYGEGILDIPGRGALNADAVLVDNVARQTMSPEQAMASLKQLSTSINSSLENNLALDGSQYKTYLLRQAIDKIRQGSPVGPTSTMKPAPKVTPQQQSALDKLFPGF